MYMIAKILISLLLSITIPAYSIAANISVLEAPNVSDPGNVIEESTNINEVLINELVRFGFPKLEAKQTIMSLSTSEREQLCNKYSGISASESMGPGMAILIVVVMIGMILYLYYLEEASSEE